MSQKRRITLIGTGLMGAPMSRNLMKAGHDLTVWNRSAERAAPLVDEGAKTAATAAEAIAGAEVIITMLSDGYATEALLADETFRAALTPGMIWIDMSSAKPEHARAHPFGHMLTQCIGLDAPPSAQVLEGDLLSGDRYLLCTDGLTGLVEDDQIADHLRRHDGDDLGGTATVGDLLEAAKAAGGHDNITAVLVTVSSQEA